MKRLLPLCLLLSACTTPPLETATLAPPAQWQAPTAENGAAVHSDWWRQFGSPQLDELIASAERDSHDLAAAKARVHQARASSVIAGAPLWPELKGGFEAGRERLLRGDGYSQLDSDSYDRSVDSYTGTLSASYELDFWGGRAAARDSAVLAQQASEYDLATVRLTLLSSVASSYLNGLALAEQLQIAEQNLANAQQVLNLVEQRYQAGAATQLELAQQRSLVAIQQRQLPLLRQQAMESRIALALLLGRPVQQLALTDERFNQLQWPTIDAGVPSDLLSRRPDIASAEARLAAAAADVTVARAAMLPSLTLTATFGTGADKFHDLVQNPFYTLAAGLSAPIFNAGKLAADRDLSQARQNELLHSYRSAIDAGLADVEKALTAIAGIDQQRHWQEQERHHAQRAFDLAQNRYQSGAETLLSVLETQRVLYQAQESGVQLRLARMQAAIALYKVLGGGWQIAETHYQKHRG
jgi:NodT family efflux transporter outer membrane factor (OMF) lipoprotein